MKQTSLVQLDEKKSRVLVLRFDRYRQYDFNVVVTRRCVRASKVEICLGGPFSRRKDGRGVRRLEREIFQINFLYGYLFLGFLLFGHYVFLCTKKESGQAMLLPD